MKLPKILILLGATLVVLAPTTAWTHGDAITTVPAEGERVGEPPAVISIDFSEPPTKDDRFTVLDGCGDNVLAGVTGQGTNKDLQIEGGSPGRWEVTYTVISATDGHETHDRFTFKVTGQKACEAPAPGEITPSVGGTGAPVGSEDPSNFPLAPVLIGTAVIVVLAVAVRVLLSR